MEAKTFWNTSRSRHSTVTTTVRLRSCLHALFPHFTLPFSVTEVREMARAVKSSRSTPKCAGVDLERGTSEADFLASTARQSLYIIVMQRDLTASLAQCTCFSAIASARVRRESTFFGKLDERIGGRSKLTTRRLAMRFLWTSGARSCSLLPGCQRQGFVLG